MLEKYKNIIKDNMNYILPIILTLFITGIFILWGYRSEINSDTATASLLAGEIINSKSFFPNDWVYVQDIWILAIQLFVLPFKMFVENEVIARGLGVLVQTVLMIIMMNRLFNKLDVKSGGLVIILLWLSGVSSVVLENVYAQASYGTMLLWCIIVFYLVINILDEKLKKKYVGILGVMLFMLNLSGMRYLVNIVAPVVITLIIWCGIEYVSSGELKISIRRLISIIIFIGVISLAGIIGFLLLSRQINYVTGLSNIVFVDISTIATNIDNILNSWLYLYGIINSVGTKLISLEGVFSAYRFVFFVFSALIIPITLTINYNKLKNEYCKFFVIFHWVYIIIITYILTFSQVAYEIIGGARYLLLNLLIIFILNAIFFEEYILNKKKVFSYIFIVLIIPFYLSSLFYQFKMEVSIDEEGLAIGAHKHDNVINFLKEKDLKFGYATYWNAYANTILSEEDVQIVGVIIGQEITPFYHLTSKIWYQPDYYKGETFILLRGEEINQINPYYITNADEKYYFEDYLILTYKNNILFDSNIIFKLPQQIGESISVSPLHEKFISQNVTIEEETIISDGTEGYILFGPYIQGIEGTYNVEFDIESLGESDNINGFGYVDIATNEGQKILGKTEIGSNGRRIMISDLNFKDETMIEFRIYVNKGTKIRVNAINIERIS